MRHVVDKIDRPKANMPIYGLLAVRVTSGRRWLSDETGRILLVELEQDATGSFVTIKDVVRGTYFGWDGDDSKLICVDLAVTTRNLL